MDVKTKRLQLKHLENSPLYKFAVTSPKPVDMMNEDEVIEASKDVKKFFIKPLVALVVLTFILYILPRGHAQPMSTPTTAHKVDRVDIHKTASGIVSSIHSEGSVYSVKKAVSFTVGQNLYLIKDRDAVTGKTDIKEVCIGEVAPSLCNKILK